MVGGILEKGVLNMDLYLYHDSRNPVYKSIFGAVRTGKKLTLRISANLKNENTCLITLRTWKSNEGEHKIPMAEKGGFYEAEITMPEEGALLWYYFIVQYQGNTVYYGNNKEQLGGVGAVYTQEPPSYQITVYDKDVHTPDWFKNAIVYQIFPDRFCRSESSTAKLFGKKGAVIHSDWNDIPHYCKDNQGNVVQYDFFGGNLAGIRKKLDYLKMLHVTAVYLNPVFESSSNHRYDTADYHHIDPMLGTNEEFSRLCADAEKKGIHIILDGVFSHTGEDSIYFNKFGHYPETGAYQSKQSPYYDWYRFIDYPDKYESWWGVKALPNVAEMTPSYLDFIINNKDSVLTYWLERGISGWRLDVIDELPETFLRKFYHTLKKENAQAVLIGEVWEDASNKMSYGEQREYLCGKDMDSAMNYALRAIMIDFILEHKDGRRTAEEIYRQMENYPQENFYAMLNLIGSHDVKRILSILGADGGTAVLTASEKSEARLKVLCTWQMTMPGAPCIYYGDEAGVTGDVDPDNRRTYPWGNENTRILEWYIQLTTLRSHNAALRTGRFIPLYGNGDIYAYARSIEGGMDVFGKKAEDGFFIIVMNRNTTAIRSISMYTDGLAYGKLYDAFEPNRVPICTVNSRFTVTLPPLGVTVLKGMDEIKEKRAGILCHPTSFPSSYGMGDLGNEAMQFIDFLSQAGQKVWQILPLTQPGEGNSPYVSMSAFAGNERLISLDKLVTMGWLKEKRFLEFKRQILQAHTYEEKWQCKKMCLWDMSHDPDLVIPWNDFAAFCQNNADWLEEYAIFSAIHDFYQGNSWTQWPDDIRNHEAAAIEYYKKELSATLSHNKFMQYIFHMQWQEVRQYAASKDIAILGDIPIFVAHDSVDCWAHQEFFDLDEQGYLRHGAGVPPDYFSADGQVWGNPLYRWDTIAADQYEWWIKRFQRVLAMVDEIRIDHFRGFASCWAIPAGSHTARDGKWDPGPGIDLFRAIYKKIPNIQLIAEDLGFITDDVCELKNKLGIPGMKILQFHMKYRSDGRYSFDTEPDCVAYTGTHDNNTLLGWYTEELDRYQQEQMKNALGLEKNASAEEIVWSFVSYVYSRRAKTIIVPLQDVLCLPSACRMNRPGISHGQWLWQAEKGQLTDMLAQRLAILCKQYGR